uniref:Period circadian regulator 2 n=1 Tax=Molossus molossus TaxID=27622 RepID=A0A7J8FT82_MOLMO|nr:period circadian regulator 2 [Molossus molossus]
MADTDDSVMMTYQMPARDVDAVLKEDREKLRLLQKLQPRFTERQKQELQEVHPWVRAGGLPAALDVAVSSRNCIPDSASGGCQCGSGWASAHPPRGPGSIPHQGTWPGVGSIPRGGVQEAASRCSLSSMFLSLSISLFF